jgi:hypothetical protein
MDYPFTSKALIKIEKFKKSVNNYLAEVNMDNIIDILKIVPDFNEFMSISELYESSRMLAEKYHDIVEVIDVRESRISNFPVQALIIRGGDKNRVLAFGFPHPNEPIGSLVLEFLSHKLVTDREFLKKLNATWIIVKVADVFGAKLNEGWFKGTFNIRKYALNYYRPPGYKQIEWSFPVEYKSFKWNKPTPETQALMKLIDEWKPTHIYSLHNAGFTGTYYYVSKIPSENVLNLFKEIPRKYNVPIHKGEPEVPYMKKIGDAVFKMPGIAESYDWLENYLGKDPSSLMEHGGSSYDYAKRVNPDIFELVCEVPYIYDYRLDLDITIGIPRRELMRMAFRKNKERLEQLEKDTEKISKHVSDDNPFYEALAYFNKTAKHHMEAEEKWIETAPELSESATVAQAFDIYLDTYLSYIFRYGLLYRSIQYETIKGFITKELEEVKENALKKLEENIDELNNLSNYYVIPIKNLVSIQLAAVLATL